jgi:hypothetical protein
MRIPPAINKNSVDKKRENKKLRMCCDTNAYTRKGGLYFCQCRTDDSFIYANVIDIYNRGGREKHGLFFG